MRSHRKECFQEQKKAPPTPLWHLENRLFCKRASGCLGEKGAVNGGPAQSIKTSSSLFLYPLPISRTNPSLFKAGNFGRKKRVRPIRNSARSSIAPRNIHPSRSPLPLARLRGYSIRHPHPPGRPPPQVLAPQSAAASTASPDDSDAKRGGRGGRGAFLALAGQRSIINVANDRLMPDNEVSAPDGEGSFSFYA